MALREPRRLWAVAECIENDCTRPPLARSLCGMHYQRRRLRGETLPPKVRKPLAGTVCCLSRCDRRAVAHRMCTRHAGRRRRYGLTIPEMETLDLQEFCDACKARPPVHVDHDHETGVFRGYLCAECNKGIGHFSDSPALLRAAADYLERS